MYLGGPVKFHQILGKEIMRLRHNEAPNSVALSIENAANPNCRYQVFEMLYDKYSPKVFGFISQYADSKQEAEEYLVQVFLRLWNDIAVFDDAIENRILYIVLIVCKPIYKNKIPKINSGYHQFLPSIQ